MSTKVNPKKTLRSAGRTNGPDIAIDELDATASARINLILPGMQNATLNALVAQTGLPRTEIVRHAIALLGVAMKGRSKGLELAMVDARDNVVSHIASAL
ncbi:hypothetical protein [Novosphingobium sp.]|uniref:hypothetical protein n=1 Tax=Novosphingobium sp. TaxID=1874826 RepID=UPI00286A95BB|nr:hypothetical protein [Novosphingobium sp.]